MSLEFSVTYSFRPFHGREVDSAPSENEYQEHLLRVKAAGAWGWRPHYIHVPNVMEIWEPKPPGNLWATPALLRDPFTFAFCCRRRSSGNMCVPREVVWIRIDRQVLLRRPWVGTFPILIRQRASFYTSVVPQLQFWHAPTVLVMLTRVSQFEFRCIRTVAGTENYNESLLHFLSCVYSVTIRWQRSAAVHSVLPAPNNGALLCPVCCLHLTTERCCAQCVACT
jgi:hypothetical protein